VSAGARAGGGGPPARWFGRSRTMGEGLWGGAAEAVSMRASRLRLKLLLLAAAVVASGCIAPLDADSAPQGERPWTLHGTFTPQHTQADIDAWCAIARDHGNECTMMKSLPPQYLLAFATLEECRAARERIAAIEEARPGACRGQSEVRLHGTFAPERTQATLDAWCDVAREHGNECALMESFPEQFALRFASFEACRRARADLAAIEHVRPGTCEAASPPADAPDEPVSSPAEREAWTLRGSWTRGYTEQDVRAWCEIAREYGNDCLVMTSEPPQFSMRFEGQRACEEARTRILALERVTAGECERAARSEGPDAPTSSAP